MSQKKQDPLAKILRIGTESIPNLDSSLTAEDNACTLQSLDDEFLKPNTEILWLNRNFSNGALFDDYTKMANPVCLINSEIINKFRYVNKYLERMNTSLKTGDLVKIFVIGNHHRKQMIAKRVPRILMQTACFMDYMLHRVVPKVGLTQKLYFSITKGRYRALSKYEVWGRLHSCGFTLLNAYEQNGGIWFLAEKISAPDYNLEASYGSLIKLKRIGKDFREIKVLKLRTMYAYSEYLQEAIYNQNGSSNGDKADDDPRVTRAGRFFRKYWLDELPMLINWFRGDVKLIGVRPLSRAKFDTYPIELQVLRTRFKPGLIPPFYADMPNTQHEMFESERVYLENYARNPITTDLHYFFKAFHNIVFKNARSK